MFQNVCIYVFLLKLLEKNLTTENSSLMSTCRTQINSNAVKPYEACLHFTRAPENIASHVINFYVFAERKIYMVSLKTINA